MWLSTLHKAQHSSKIKHKVNDSAAKCNLVPPNMAHQH